ncbi:sensor histidine kinase [uncultured Litoreibacter sp.]|uniref:sensor histidine kinase n=1 Tax=uncultured Litoreibacter sp. TaxID=1392394 RepID=UPI002629EBB7|nr:sensor histidine kinase [uncultured Litoreibacter sp.]
MNTRSLRLRLIFIILIPLLLVAGIAAVWQLQTTTKRAEEIFDRGLLSAALAISRDVALSGGDALSSSTRRLVNDTSGGELFYHVFAPDGVFVTGYATPPALGANLPTDQEDPYYFDALYQGQAVRVLRFRDAMSVDGLTGLFTITVWQPTQVRASFVQAVGFRAIGVIALIVGSVAAIVWFGVGLGLRPLLDLQEAIAKRTPSELEPIRRSVPVEVRGVVSTLNSLLDRVSRRISSKDEFISNAAHQLRNPIAGILALAEAVESAPNAKAAKSRSKELVAAARDATYLTNQLLSFERASGDAQDVRRDRIEVSELITTCLTRLNKDVGKKDVEIIVAPASERLHLLGDALMLQEAILNLLTNALVHGGPTLSRIEVSARRSGENVEIAIQDDGRGILLEKLDQARVRFGQADAGPGSGLGLSIVERVLDNHTGHFELRPTGKGLRAVVSMPSIRS